MKSKQRITLLLAEDHAVVREGLRRLLQAESDIDVVGEAANGRQAVGMARELRPAVVVMDIAMPGLNGLEATRQICRADSEIKVLILSAHSDDSYVERARASGAVGYLIKQTSAHFLSEAIREVQKGNTSFSPSVARQIRHRDPKSRDRKGRAENRVPGLTSREMEALQLIAEGAANKQIAAELGIHIKTVEKHRDHLMQKLGIHETAGLTRYAIAAGIVECDVPLTIV